MAKKMLDINVYDAATFRPRFFLILFLRFDFPSPEEKTQQCCFN